MTVVLLHRAVPAKRTNEGLRALSGEIPIRPESVQEYLESKFVTAFKDVSYMMLGLPMAIPPSQTPYQWARASRGARVRSKLLTLASLSG